MASNYDMNLIMKCYKINVLFCIHIKNEIGNKFVIVYYGVDTWPVESQLATCQLIWELKKNPIF